MVPKLNYLTVLDVIVNLFPDFLNLTHTHLRTGLFELKWLQSRLNISNLVII